MESADRYSDPNMTNGRECRAQRETCLARADWSPSKRKFQILREWPTSTRVVDRIYGYAGHVDCRGSRVAVRGRVKSHMLRPVEVFAGTDSFRCRLSPRPITGMTNAKFPLVESERLHERRFVYRLALFPIRPVNLGHNRTAGARQAPRPNKSKDAREPHALWQITRERLWPCEI